MQAYAGHIAEKLEESELAEKRAFVALYDTHEAADEAVHELQRSGFASNLIQLGEIVKIQEADNQVTTLQRPSQPVVDFCRNTHLLCRMAKKLGCQFCAKK